MALRQELVALGVLERSRGQFLGAPKLSSAVFQPTVTAGLIVLQSEGRLSLYHYGVQRQRQFSSLCTVSLLLCHEGPPPTV